MGVIRKVDEPTDWVNLIEKPKSNNFCVCLNPTMPLVENISSLKFLQLGYLNFMFSLSWMVIMAIGNTFV